jgi:hypothetical protein
MNASISLAPDFGFAGAFLLPKGAGGDFSLMANNMWRPDGACKTINSTDHGLVVRF